MSARPSLAKVSGEDDVSRRGSWKFRPASIDGTDFSSEFASVQATPAQKKVWSEWLRSADLTEIEFSGRGAKPKWVGPVMESMRRLLRLEPGWDTYGGKVVNATAVSSALGILGKHMNDSMRQPWIVPTSKGGLQLEWHTSSLDVEIEISVNGEVTVDCDPADIYESNDLKRLFKHLILSRAPVR